MGKEYTEGEIAVDHLDHLGRPRVMTVNDLPSKTIQSDHDQADIKKILQKYKEVGIVDNLRTTETAFADVTNFTDFADVMRHAKEAEHAFMRLPSKVREIFDHDVGTWLDTAHDPEKLASLVEEGKIEPFEQPAAAPTTNNTSGDGTSGNADTVPEGS